MVEFVRDFVLETANSPGGGIFVLAGADTGRRTFAAAFGTGAQAYYYATDGTGWEEGYGTVTSGSPNTLSRDTVVENSLGTTARINFAGLVQVYSEVPAQRAVYAAPDNATVPMGNRRLTGLAAGTGADHAPRLDQVGERFLGLYAAAGGSITVPLPTGITRYRLNLRGITPSAITGLYFRASTDGGSTIRSGAGDYLTQILEATGSSAPTSSANIASFAQFCGGTAPSFPAFGHIEFDMGKVFNGLLTTNTGTALQTDVFSGYYAFPGAATHLYIGAIATGATITAGECRLTGLP